MLLLQTMPEDIAHQLSDALKEGEAPASVFSAVKHHLYHHLHDMYMRDFSKRYVLLTFSHNVYVFVTVCCLSKPSISNIIPTCISELLIVAVIQQRS